MRATRLLCALALEAIVASTATSQRARSAQPAARQRFLAVDGMKIRYRAEGRGPAILLLHGFAGRLEDMDTLAAALPRHRIIRLDLRGFGQSAHPHDPAQYGVHLVDDLFAVLDRLGEHRVSIVGYSLGAAVAAKAAARHPDRIRKLVLIGGGPLGEHSRIMQISDSAAAALEDGRGLRPFFIALTPPGVAPPTDSLMGAVSRQVLSGGDSVAWSAFLRSQRLLVLQPREVRSLTMPILLLAGTADPLAMEALEWQPVLANAEFREIPGATHEDIMARSDLAEAVRDFLLAGAVRTTR